MGKSRQLSNTSTLGVSTTLVATYDANTTSTGFFQVPVGTTAQRPVPITRGYIRYNTTLNALESANGTAWANVGSGAASSGGGGVTWISSVQNTSFIAVKNEGCRLAATVRPQVGPANGAQPSAQAADDRAKSKPI